LPRFCRVLGRNNPALNGFPSRRWWWFWGRTCH